MVDSDEIKKAIPGFSNEIYKLLAAKGKIIKLPPHQLLLKQGYFVNAIPIVLTGLLKVTSRDEHKEILLYYIEKGESCIMSFSACINNSKSKIFAITEQESRILMISSYTVKDLLKQFPLFNSYFHQLYQNRYEELIGTIDQLVFKRFDERLLQYFQEKSKKLGIKELKMTHQEIAQDNGTIREVVSRALKKLENEGKIKLARNTIKII